MHDSSCDAERRSLVQTAEDEGFAFVEVMHSGGMDAGWYSQIERGVVMAVHGGDFVADGLGHELDRHETAKNHKLGMSQGSRSEDRKNVVILGRVVGYHDLGVAEPEPRVVELPIAVGLTARNSTADAENTELIEADDILDPGVRTSSRSVVMRLGHLCAKLARNPLRMERSRKKERTLNTQ